MITITDSRRSIYTGTVVNVDAYGRTVRSASWPGYTPTVGNKDGKLIYGEPRPAFDVDSIHDDERQLITCQIRVSHVGRQELFYEVTGRGDCPFLAVLECAIRAAHGDAETARRYADALTDVVRGSYHREAYIRPSREDIETAARWYRRVYAA